MFKVAGVPAEEEDESVMRRRRGEEDEEWMREGRVGGTVSLLNFPPPSRYHRHTKNPTNPDWCRKSNWKGGDLEIPNFFLGF